MKGLRMRDGGRRADRQVLNRMAETPRAHRQCAGKRGYPSKAVARGAVRVMTRDGVPVPGKVLNAYKCSTCGAWHIGHTARTRRRTR